MKTIRSACGMAVAILLILSALPAPSTAAEKVSFRRIQIDAVFRSEGVAVADLNGDGKKDIAVGSVYYTAPDWKMHAITEQPLAFTPEEYSGVFACFAADVNADGRPDLITVDIPGKATWWFENPGRPNVPWKRQLAVPVTNNESPIWADLTGDDRPELVFGYSPDPQNPDSPQRRLAFAGPGKTWSGAWPIRTFSEPEAPGSLKYSHGLGVGDIDGDGRNDVLTTAGWWKQPSESGGETWPFQAAPLGEDCAHMLVYDFDGDGDNDVLSSSAHRFGIWWHEQTPDGWITHTIDDTISQTHAVCLADINGDGRMDFVTGKRWWAHMGRDPGAEMPALVVWYELSRKDGKPFWKRHTVDNASGVGTQFEVADVNGDGLLDIVTSNKKGVYCFQQIRQP